MDKLWITRILTSVNQKKSLTSYPQFDVYSTTHFCLNNVSLIVKGGTMLQTLGAVDFTALTTALSLTAFEGVIQSILPIVGVAVLVGFLFYVIRWAIGLFRGA